ncbi:MAG: hypothetical protein R3B35_00595 [Gemmatimonadales bacterium]
MASFRKLRAILVIALTWGLFWVIGGALLTGGILALLWMRAGRITAIPLDELAFALVSFAMIGAVLGTVFATSLAWAGRRRDWRLTGWRAATLGALGGTGCYLLWFLGVEFLVNAAFAPTLGGTVAFGALGALTGVLTHGTAARGRLPAGAEAAGQLPAGE